MSSYSFSSPVLKAFAAAALALVAACASSGDDQTVAGFPDAGAMVTAGDTGTPPVLTPSSTCATIDEGTQRACACSDGSQGTQACLGGTYQACNCTPQVITVQTLCKAGFYSGQFSGKYKPGAFGFGLVGGFIEVDIMGAGANGYPALSFTLEANQQGGGEFSSFSVKNGCMIGSANAYGTNNPFVGLITGELDCKTGKFSGMITGRYDLLGFGLKFEFAGTADSQFEAPQSRLKDGVWNVKEPPALDGTAAGGGGGTWSAIWESDAPPSGEDPCSSSSLAPDAGAASDAGTGRADAGP